MRRRVVSGAVAVIATLALLIGMSSPAGATWHSTINTQYSYRPPVYGSTITQCNVESMNGEIFGVAFAKIEADNSHCRLSAVQVVYVLGGTLYGGGSNSTNYVGVWSQDTGPAGSNITGANYGEQTDDYGANILWSTTVF